MSRRNEHNIGESNQTSVKVHYGPGGKSNWSLGWGEQPQKEQVKPVTINKYHNESQLQFNDPTLEVEDEEKKREEERRRKEEEINNKLPTYDPRLGNKTNIHFGNDKPDYRRKDEVITSVKVHNPPGGRSNIQFG